MLTARALATEETDRDDAKALALEAAKLAPDLVPAAALAARMLAEAGDLRKAARIVHKAWEAHPHPDLARVFSDLRFGDTARDRLKRIEALAKKVPDHIESALALARAALDAQEYVKARAALAPHLTGLTRRAALLMAEIERAEHGDEGRAREWIARALHAAPDPAWTADGHVSDRWLPVSPNGLLDAFKWRVPVAAIPSAAPVIESAPPTAAPAIEQKVETPTAAAETETMPPLRRGVGEPPKPDAVIPLVHAPDDPGPETEPAEESAPRQAQTGGWRKIFE